MAVRCVTRTGWHDHREMPIAYQRRLIHYGFVWGMLVANLCRQGVQ